LIRFFEGLTAGVDDLLGNKVVETTGVDVATTSVESIKFVEEARGIQLEDILTSFFGVVTASVKTGLEDEV